jgi:hypothetical protein
MFASAISVITAIPPAAVTDARIWRPGRTPGMGIAVPVVVARRDHHRRGRSRIAVNNAWIWSPGRTPGLGITVVVTRCDNCGRRRSRSDWPTAGNKSSAGKARVVVPDDAAPRRPQFKTRTSDPAGIAPITSKLRPGPLRRLRLSVSIAAETALAESSRAPTASENVFFCMSHLSSYRPRNKTTSHQIVRPALDQARPRSRGHQVLVRVQARSPAN